MHKAPTTAMLEVLGAKKGLVHHPQGVILPIWTEDSSTDSQLNKGQERFLLSQRTFFLCPSTTRQPKDLNHSIAVMSIGISGYTRKSNLSKQTTVVTLVWGYACAHFQRTKLINACDMANWANASNLRRFPRGLCAAHTEISPIKVSLHFNTTVKLDRVTPLFFKSSAVWRQLGGWERKTERQRISKSVRALQGVLECEWCLCQYQGSGTAWQHTEKHSPAWHTANTPLWHKMPFYCQ